MDYAFQPIVSIYWGVCLGYEALLRGWEAAGFASIQDVFDAAFAGQNLFHVELALREKAVRKFTEIRHRRKTKLFFNIGAPCNDAASWRPLYKPPCRRSIAFSHMNAEERGLGKSARYRIPSQ